LQELLPSARVLYCSATGAVRLLDDDVFVCLFVCLFV
jgi:hypothetical protein